ncbi:MAG TPA: hypothetical protein VFJ64_04665 [Solirubrobacterales bacterium]|nr:hypothetical protein [Solirubrobacterales bacterium]
MTVRYAYLAIEQRRYTRKASREAKWPGLRAAPSKDDHGESFPDRLRGALDAAAEWAGYGSLESWLGVDVPRRPTPSRAEHVQGLLDAGLLNGDAEVSQIVNGTVPDFAWEILREVHADGDQDQQIPDPAVMSSRSKTPFIDSWSFALHTGDGVTPIEIDPAQAPGHALPVALITQTLEALSSEGWMVVHISEDRSIDDGASASHVVRQRVLLRR